MLAFWGGVENSTVDPTLKAISPIRDLSLTRDVEIAFAKEHKLPITQTEKSPYSIDQNVWGRAIETGFLEDPWNGPTKDCYSYTDDPAFPPVEDEVVIEFKEGIPVKIDGRDVTPLQAIEEMNRRAGAQGIGRIDLIEDRLVGIKSRELYEAPGAVALITAHQELENCCLEREQHRIKRDIDKRWAELVYDAQWFSPAVRSLNAFIEETQQYVSGEICMTRHGGGAVVCSTPCLGYSFRLNESVSQLILDRFPITASIAVGAAVLWLVIGVATGVWAALKRDTLIDRTLLGLSVVGVSAPSYLIGLLAVIAFSLVLQIFPSGGYVNFHDDPVGWFTHLLLPWLVLAVLSAAGYTRVTRTQMIGELSQDYIRTARSKGVPESVIVFKHALRNALLPVMTMFGLDLGGLLGGAVLTEKVFSMQGLGSLLLDSVSNLDLQVLVGATLFAAVLVIVANLIVDICYSLLDPRVALGTK